MDLMQYYKVLAQRNNPDLSDEDVASSLKGVPQDKLQSALSPLMPPDLSADLSAKDPNTLGSSYDVNSSTDTVKAQGGGLQPPMSKMDMDAAGITSPAPTIPYGQNTPPADPLASLPPEPNSPVNTESPQQNAPIEHNAPVAGDKPADKGAAAIAPSPLSSVVADPSSSDVEKRKALDDKNGLLKKVGALSSLGAGIGDAIGNAAVPYGGKGSSGSQEKVMANTKDQIATNKEEFETKLKQDPTSDISKSYRQMVLQIAPDLAKNQNFVNMSAQSIGDKLPLIDTMMKARAQEDAKKLGLEQIRATRDLNSGYKHDTQQDRLEQQAKQSLLTMRGDQSLQRVESQRDAAIQAYNTIDQIKKEGRMPSQIEYYDILGQMWKARTGASPTDQAIRDLDAKTFKGSLAKATQYFTGKPAGVTTQDILSNIQNFAKQSGAQADQLHEAYMKTRLTKPHDLDEERWTPLAQGSRGMSFAEATRSLADKAVPTVASQQDYDRLPSGASYKDANGKTYRKK